MSGDRTTLHALRDIVDRQILDVDDMLSGKVDDIQLAPNGDETAVVGLLSGAGALAPRLRGRLGEHFRETVRRLSSPQWEPICITPDLYKRTKIGFELTVPRAYLHEIGTRASVPHRRPEGSVGELDDLRVSDLVGAHVFDAEGEPVDHVSEVRLLAAGPATDAAGVPMTVDALLVGFGAVGERLGYALPHGPMRPYALNRMFRSFARHARVVPWRAVVELGPNCITLNVTNDALHPPDEERRR